MNLKITLLRLFFTFFCFSKIIAWPQISPRRFGSEWGPGHFSEAVEAQRLLPILLYYRLHLQVIKYAAKAIVKHPNIKKIFAKLKEGYLKQEIRRQYFLYTKGEKLDGKPISFKMSTLFKSGFFQRK